MENTHTHYEEPISFTLECKRIVNINKYDRQVLIFTPTACDQNKKTFEFLQKRQLLAASHMFDTLKLSDKFIKCYGSDKKISIKNFVQENNHLFAVTEDGKKQNFLHNDFETLKIGHRLIISDKNIIDKYQKMELSIDDLCELSKSQFIKINITISPRAFYSANLGSLDTVYVSCKIKNIKLISSDISKLMMQQPDKIKKNETIIQPKQNQYIPLRSAKKNTIVGNIMNIITSSSSQVR